MSESTFRFKHFTVHQDKCAMKVGTDGVLLGAWINPGNSKLILDVGTGSGLIALMLAQKIASRIDAIDIDESAYTQARENFLISPWFKQLNIYHQSFQEFASAASVQYDLIVSNPPYFHNASKPAEESRLCARHHDQLSFKELVDGVKKILSPTGKFCVVLPQKEGMEFMDLAMRNSLFCKRLTKVKTKADGMDKRLLMEFTHNFGFMIESCLTIKEKDGSFSKEYVELTENYFLNLSAAPIPVAQ